MSRPFEVTVDAEPSVDDVFAAFSREQYWQDRVAAYGDSMSLAAFDVAPDGSVAVSTVQDLQEAVLPAAFAHLIRGGAMVTRAETWRLADDGTAVSDLVITGDGMPLSGDGTARVEQAPGGSRMSVTGRVKVKIPLLGGQVEKFVVGQIVEEIRQIQLYTAAWITQNA
ncbi:MAG: DUF2505 domain-containing protein [Mycolicibacterium insubricum]|nr:DUF2505 domain-containing protein [Mycobacterium sp.]